jgi:acyl-coenzyme A synthetase/AMP-(fatty) acid ligase
VRWRIADERLAVRSPYLSDGLPLDGDGFFITADRAVESSDGRFLLQGRVDSIVKVSGRRVDTAEVESRLLALPGVNDAVIIARATDSARGHEMLALVASKLSPQTLTLALRQQLPPVAWPRVLRVVQSVPTTPSGKRDLPAINAMLDENRSEAASDETSSAHVVGSHGSSEPPQRR